MFKGLRTKIESEQKGQVGQNTRAQNKGLALGGRKNPTINQEHPSSTDKRETILNPHQNQPGAPDRLDKSPNIPGGTLVVDNSDQRFSTSSDQANTSDYSHTIHTRGIEDSDHGQEQGETIDELVGQINNLRGQLKTVIKERDEIDHQRKRSYQIIEELEKNLHQHKATNTNLEIKLAEFESKLNDQKTEISEDAKSNGSKNSDEAFGKSFNPRRHLTTASDTQISDNVEILHQEIIELQSQIAKKNRLLKIRQQNLVDMKRTLQKEIMDHGRTRDELIRLQRQLKDYECGRMIEDHEKASNRHTLGESANQTDYKDNVHLTEATKEPKQGDGLQETTSSQIGNISEDTMSLNAAVGATTVQFDRISYLSRSSASVDDLESNDLQHSNNNKELNHEYLRNVLFRYMTSSDSETTQHLVKAISVLMDFTPEQSAAIKNSMHGRMSSWLRLK